MSSCHMYSFKKRSEKGTLGNHCFGTSGKKSLKMTFPLLGDRVVSTGFYIENFLIGTTEFV